MNVPHGVKSTTLENLEFEAGLVLKTKYAGGTFDKSTVLCATTGGITVNIAQNKQVIQFDGVLENTAGIERIIGWTASVQFATKEVDKEKILLALGYATSASATATGVTTDTVTLGQGVIPVGSYQNLYILGKMSDGTWRQIVISNAINVNGLQESRNDKGETQISFDLQANYGLQDQDTPPVSIEYITVSSGT